jgi:hypothetical protein
MISMISLRTFRLATTKGHVIRFEAKKPQMVPNDIAAEAMAAGCVPTDEKDAPFIDDMTRANVEFQGDIRRSVVLLAIEAIAKVNDAKNFNGAGIPKAKVLSERLGFDVTPTEVTALWQEYMGAKNSGVDLPMHPQAEQVLAVLNAEDRETLLALAAQFEAPTDKLDGLSTRDARRFLLTKFHGLTGA